MSNPSAGAQRENHAGGAARQWLARIGLAAAGLLASWAIAEAGLRLAAPILPPGLQIIVRQVRPTPFSPVPVPAPPLYQFDGTYGVIARQDHEDDLQPLATGEAFHVTTLNPLDPGSQLGFRVPSPGWAPRLPADVVVVGDSFSFCFTEYADCWVGRLAGQHGLSIMDLGVPATGSISHGRILQSFGLAYHPRIVIWQWYGNDFNEDYGLTHEGVTGVAAPVYPDDKDLPTWTGWFKRNSAVYALGRYIAASRQFADQNPVWVDHYRISDGSLNLMYGRPYTVDAQGMNNPRNQAGVELTRQALQTARDTLSAQGIPLVVLLIPTKEEVYRAWTEPVLGASWLDPVIEGRQKMMALCQDLKLICVDVTDALTAHAGRKELLYWPLDSHVNPAGNQVIADQVWQALQAAGLAN